MQLDSDALAGMAPRTRAALVNSISGFKSANLIGTASASGETNLAIMSSVVHLGSHPPLLALVVRPGGEERHTLANILATQSYTINHVNTAIIEAAHQTAARYPQQVSEFDATGLTPEWVAGLGAPLVAEANVKLGMRLREHQPLAINGTHLVIGEVVVAIFPEESLLSDGALDLSACSTTALSGLDAYHQAVPLKRMAYAKPELPPRLLG